MLCVNAMYFVAQILSKKVQVPSWHSCFRIVAPGLNPAHASCSRIHKWQVELWNKEFEILLRLFKDQQHHRTKQVDQGDHLVSSNMLLLPWEAHQISQQVCKSSYFLNRWTISSQYKTSRNAYIMTAMVGSNFCKASQDAFTLITSNILRGFFVNQVSVLTLTNDIFEEISNL